MSWPLITRLLSIWQLKKKMTRSWILKIEPNRGRPPSCQVYSTEYLEYIIFCKAIYLLLVNTGSSGNAATSVKNGMRPVSAGLIEHEANGSSQYCPRHHHHTTQTPQQPQQRQTPSPNKRHRLTPRPPNIQRPCLDFEKMQQVNTIWSGATEARRAEVVIAELNHQMAKLSVGEAGLV